MLSTAGGPLSLDTVSSANVIVVETSNLIIRSASEFCLSSAPVSIEAQESTFTSNPFFKLRSLSSQSLVEQEIRVVRQREEEWKRQREEMWRRRREDEWRRGKERYDTVLVSPSLSDAVSFNGRYSLLDFFSQIKNQKKYYNLLNYYKLFSQDVRLTDHTLLC